MPTYYTFKESTCYCLCMGIISGQWVGLSMTVSTYLCPSADTVPGCHKSMCTWYHGRSETIGFRKHSLRKRLALCSAQGPQRRTTVLTVLLICGQ